MESQPPPLTVSDKEAPSSAATGAMPLETITAESRAAKGIHDPSVTFEEYAYWAKLSRAEEMGLPDAHHPLSQVLGFKPKTTELGAVNDTDVAKAQAASEDKDTKSVQPQVSVSVEEWSSASRALRTATWGAVFYLITTDILGPFSVPWAMSQMGYGPGVTLYTVFGALAGYTGWQLWQIFLTLDSVVYPMKTFGDLVFRIYGTSARHFCNTLQSIQLIFNVGIIIIVNGQSIYQINPNFCYIAACIIWAFAGMILGQIRTLRRFGWIAHLAIWLNVTILIMTMAVVTHTPPNYMMSHDLNIRPAERSDAEMCTADRNASEVCKVRTTVGSPPDATGFTNSVTGLMQAVYSYGGSILFCEFLSEMRKPMDFWKALLCAQSFIFICYIFHGLYVYSFQGQFTINPAFQGMSPFAAYTTGNIISLISGLIAATLYGNIGIKVLYQNILIELFHFPSLDSKKGKIAWAAVVPVYWSIAFILAAAIPNITALGAMVAAFCFVQFSYTFPPLLMIGHNVQRDAIQVDKGEGFDPRTGETVRKDDGWKRWLRGYMKQWHINTFNLVFALGALVTAGLGAYSAVITLKAIYAAGHQTAFSCTH